MIIRWKTLLGLMIFSLWLLVSSVLFSYGTTLNTKEITASELFRSIQQGLDQHPGSSMHLVSRLALMGKKIRQSEFMINISTIDDALKKEYDPFREYRIAIKESTRLHPVIGIITSDRKSYLMRLLRNLLNDCEADPKLIFIFDDGSVSVEKEVKSMGINYKAFDDFDMGIAGGGSATELRIKHMNQHYLSIFNFFFGELNQEFAIFLEDDLLMSPDALDYLKSGAKLLSHDSSLYCISTWNDNSFRWNMGQQYPLGYKHDTKPQTFLPGGRSDFFMRESHFGGLGWGTSKKVFEERIKDRWLFDVPWDVVMQMYSQGVDCIFPEVSKSFHNGPVSWGLSSISPLSEPSHMWSSMVIDQQTYKDLYKFQNMQTLLKDNYENEVIAPYIEKAIVIEDIHHIAYFVDQSLLTFMHVENSYDWAWNKQLIGLGIWGNGNGGTVRGAYNGAGVFTRMLGNSLLWLGTYTQFFKEKNVTEWQAKIFDPYTVDPLYHYRNPKTSAFLWRIMKDRVLVSKTTTNQTESCNEFCRSIGLFCNDLHMVLINDCEVLEEYVNFETCLPEGSQVSAPCIDEISGIVFLNSGFTLNCASRDEKFTRICPCAP